MLQKIVENTVGYIAPRIIKRVPNLVKYIYHIRWILQLPIINKFYRMAKIALPAYIRNEAHEFDVIYSKFPNDYLEPGEKKHLDAILTKNELRICEDLLLIKFSDGFKMLCYSDSKILVLNRRAYKGYLAQCGVEFKKGDVVIDIGAHIGAFAVPAFYYNGVKIFCYEPHPTNYKLLKTNFEINDKGDSGNYIVCEEGVSSTQGFSNFSYGGSSTTGTLVKNRFSTHDDYKIIPCRTVTPSSIFADNGIEHCKMLKVDCEGCEYDIFDSIGDDILSKIEYLAVEIHFMPCRKPHDLVSFLEEKNFIEVSRETNEEAGFWECGFRNLPSR